MTASKTTEEVVDLSGHVWHLEAAADSYEEAVWERREAVIAAVEAGMSKSQVARLARVSRPTVDKWLQEPREDGDHPAWPRPGHPSEG